MMHPRDWISFLIGSILAGLGLFPLLNSFNVGPAWFALDNVVPFTIFAYIAAGMGLYLLMNSFIEITNSNKVGWISFLIALAVLAIGLLKLLADFNFVGAWADFPWLSETVYYIIFTLEGLFLMVAGFAMEL
ncbi:MAG: hypothetical protein GXP63_05145 [DPANN group archaeon]|nr:hypothetical protein [DPANN group archaeon]